MGSVRAAHSAAGALLTSVVALAACRPTGASGADAGADAAAFALPDCESKSGAQADLCYREAAEQRLEAGYCARMRIEGLAEACFATIAEKRNDPGVCLRSGTDAARANCVTKLATTRREPKVCDRVEAAGLRSRCIHAVAKTAADSKLCAPIEDVTERDACYIDNALAQPTYCKDVVDIERRERCFGVASEKNPTLCGEITTPAKRDECWTKNASKEPSLCEKVGAAEDTAAREPCYRRAISGGSPEICPKMPTPRLREICISETGRGKPGLGVAVCADLKIDEVHDECLTYHSSWVPSACLDIRDAGKKKQCASRVAFPGREPRLCPLLDGDARKRCLAEVQPKTL